MNSEKAFQEFKNSYLKPGKINWIGVRPERKADLVSLNETLAVEGKGLEGDHAMQKPKASKRQVTLIQAEHLHVVAQLLDRSSIDPGLCRRNLVVSGISLCSLQEKRIVIGDAILEITGEAWPCDRMEANLGPGGYNAMRGHGGWTARVLQGGMIRVGDSVSVDT